MSIKVFQDLFLTSGGQTTFSSQPVSLGSANGAMFEVCLKAASALVSPGVRCRMEASNDGQNWTPYIFGATLTVSTNLGSSAPQWKSVVPTTSATTPYSQLRLTATLLSSATGQSVLLDGSIRTYQKA